MCMYIVIKFYKFVGHFQFVAKHPPEKFKVLEKAKESEPGHKSDFLVC